MAKLSEFVPIYIYLPVYNTASILPKIHDSSIQQHSATLTQLEPNGASLPRYHGLFAPFYDLCTHSYLVCIIQSCINRASYSRGFLAAILVHCCELDYRSHQFHSVSIVSVTVTGGSTVETYVGSRIDSRVHYLWFTQHTQPCTEGRLSLIAEIQCLDICF